MPAGWTAAVVNDVIELNPKTEARDTTLVGFVPMQSLGTGFRSKLSFEPRPWGDVKKAYTHFADGDVLLAKITPCFENGKAGLAQGLPSGLGAGSSEFFVCRPRPQAIDPRYFLAWVSGDDFRTRATVQMTGSVGHKRVPKDFLLSDVLPLAPYAEQQRIADKLDTVLARVDACRDRLARVAPLLKRFRQSVLAAATSGRLTDDWRSTRQTLECGADLIKSDAAAKSALLRRDEGLAKKKSSANSEIDDSYTFPLPESWAFTSWGKLSEWITYGFTRPMPATSKGVKLVTAKNVHPFELRTEDCGFTSDVAFSELSEKDKPHLGDLLITKDGTIGRAAVVRSNEPFCINQSVAVCWLRSTTMNRRFLEIVANVDYTQRFVMEKAKGMAIQHLSITDFAQCPVPVPPLAEQDEIVRRVEALFAFADRLETRIAQAQTAVDRLTPSLLAKAFRGELVPQDPKDEPAIELLRRLQADRPAGKSPRRRRAAA